MSLKNSCVVFFNLYVLGVALYIGGGGEEIEQVPENISFRFINDTWMCGVCHNLTEKHFVYEEVNYINGDVGGFMDMEIQLSAETMRCVVIAGDNLQQMEIRRTGGSCEGEDLTMNITPHNAVTFNVTVYG